MALGEALQDTVPSTIDDFFLPGSQPGESGNLENPSKCDNCHGGYDEVVEPAFLWRGSMMSQAARDPLFYACLAIANQDVPESGDLCIRCHSPKGWLEERSIPTDGSALTTADREGITCDFCHKLVTPTMIGVNPYPDDSIYTDMTLTADQDYLMYIDTPTQYIGNGMYIADNANVKRGPYHDADANHQFYYSPFHSRSALCGTCHDVSNPAFDAVVDEDGEVIDYVPNEWGVSVTDSDPHSQLPIERTYSEWLMSAYNTPEGVESDAFGGNLVAVSTCQDCHMRDTTGYGCNKNPPLREDLPMHDMTGANTFIPLVIEDLYPGEADTAALTAGIERARYMLKHAASMSLSVDSMEKEASVTVINETGHKLPTGYPEGRRIWLNVRAWSQTGEMFESGNYNWETAQLTVDSVCKVYEVKPGLSPGLALSLSLPPGPSFHFVLNDTVYKDNRIPPRGYTFENFKSVGAAPVGYTYPDSQYWDVTSYEIPFEGELIAVEASLYYQTASKEYIEFLRDENTTNHWGDTLYSLWSNHGKSAPELMQYAHWGADVSDNDGDGFIAALDCDDNDAEVYPGGEEVKDCKDNNCNGLVDETNTEFTVWTGCGGSSQWNDTLNWSTHALPTPETMVLIPDSPASGFYPIISDSVRLRSLEVEAGSSIIVEAGGVLTIIPQALQLAAKIDGILEVFGDVQISASDTLAIEVGPLGAIDVAGNMSVNSLDHTTIQNSGVVEVHKDGELMVDGNTQPVIHNMPGANLIIKGILDIRQ